MRFCIDGGFLCYWTPLNVRKHVINCSEPNRSWAKHPVKKVWYTTNSYTKADRKCLRLMDSSSVETEDDATVHQSRPRRRPRRFNSDSSSDDDSIPTARKQSRTVGMSGSPVGQQISLLTPPSYGSKPLTHVASHSSRHSTASGNQRCPGPVQPEGEKGQKVLPRLSAMQDNKSGLCEELPWPDRSRGRGVHWARAQVCSTQTASWSARLKMPDQQSRSSAPFFLDITFIVFYIYFNCIIGLYWMRRGG
ncbi:uncharacterized protein LOC134875193 [Eleginops maclovinus]|uniref:uncharacterized protein LOC134875193 n=1 Tax=Eleginops maclovinus TaxID=56733 RepID=UPI003080B5A5